MTHRGGLAALCRVEVANTLGRRRFQGMSALFVAVVVWAAVLAVERHRAEVAAQELRAEKLRDELAGKKVGEVASLWLPACKPPWELTLVVDGGQATVPDCYIQQLIAWETPQLERAGPRNPRLPPFLALDWIFAVSSILFLAACLELYDAVCGERLSGLLKITFSYPLPRWWLVAAKLLAGWVCLSLPLLLGLSLSLLVSFRGMPEIFTPQNLGKMAAVTVLCLWAVLLFVAVGLLASLCARDPAHSLIALLILWMSWVVVVPALATLGARQWVPIPLDTEVERWREGISQVLEWRNQGSGTAWRSRDQGRRDNYAWERRSVKAENEQFRRHEELRREVAGYKLWQARMAQDLAAVFSPTALIHGIAVRFTGTGFLRDEAFLTQAWNYRKALEKRLEHLDALDPDSPHLLFFSEYMSQKSLPDGAIPEFHFRERTIAEGLIASMPGLAWLAMETILLLALVFGLASRYALD